MKQAWQRDANNSSSYSYVQSEEMELGREYDYYYTVGGEGVGETLIKWLPGKSCVIQFPNSLEFSKYFLFCRLLTLFIIIFYLEKIAGCGYLILVLGRRKQVDL